MRSLLTTSFPVLPGKEAHAGLPQYWWCWAGPSGQGSGHWTPHRKALCPSEMVHRLWDVLRLWVLLLSNCLSVLPSTDDTSLNWFQIGRCKMVIFLTLSCFYTYWLEFFYKEEFYSPLSWLFGVKNFCFLFSAINYYFLYSFWGTSCPHLGSGPSGWLQCPSDRLPQSLSTRSRSGPGCPSPLCTCPAWALRSATFLGNLVMITSFHRKGTHCLFS